MTDTEVLIYLERAEEMGYHLCDFFVPENEFANHFVFTFFRREMLDEISAYTSFAEWNRLNVILQMGQRAATAELDACLKQAEEISYDLSSLTVAAYVDVNEYAFFCFERLKACVDEFYFDWFLCNDVDGRFLDDNEEV